MSLPFGALCHLDLRNVVWCLMEPSGARYHVSAMRLVSRGHISARRPMDALVVERMLLPLVLHAIWCQVDSASSENISLLCGALCHLGLRKSHLVPVRASLGDRMSTIGSWWHLGPDKGHLCDQLVRMVGGRQDSKVSFILFLLFYLFYFWNSVFMLWIFLFCFCFKKKLRFPRET